MNTRVNLIAGRLSEAQHNGRDKTTRRLGIAPSPNYFVTRAISLIDETTAQIMLRWQLFGEKSLKNEKLNAARLAALGVITNTLIKAGLEPDSLLTLIDRMADGFTDIFPYAGVAVEFRSDILSGNYPSPDLHSFPNLYESHPGLISQITREPTTVEDVNQKMMGLPLLDGKRNLLGVIVLSLDPGHPGFPPEIMDYAERLRETSSLMLENIANKERLEQETITDGLTGLKNRRYFDKVLYDEYSRSDRYNRPLSLLMFDIDFFKKINDSYGHPVGDRALIELAELIKESVRKEIDIAARLGGDEFALILPETTIDSAKILAERIREAVEKHSFKTDKGETIKVTVSIGVATLNPDIHKAEDLVGAADKNLYQAKRTGRNSFA